MAHGFGASTHARLAMRPRMTSVAVASERSDEGVVVVVVVVVVFLGNTYSAVETWGGLAWIFEITNVADEAERANASEISVAVDATSCGISGGISGAHLSDASGAIRAGR